MKRVLAVVTCVLALAAASVASASTTVLPFVQPLRLRVRPRHRHDHRECRRRAQLRDGHSGSIAIRGGKHKVGGWTKKKWDSNLNANVYTGKSMCYRVSGKFWVRVAGTVKNFGSTARGSVTFYGSGVYTLGNGKQHSWSRRPSHTLSIRW